MSEITEGSMFFLGGGRRRGRPKLEEPRSTVSTRLSVKHHDLLIRLADERSMSVSAIVRDFVEVACKVVESKRGISVLKK